MQVQRREPWWTEQGWWTNLSSNLDRDISKTENWQSKVNQSEVFYEIIKISENGKGAPTVETFLVRLQALAFSHSGISALQTSWKHQKKSSKILIKWVKSLKCFHGKYSPCAHLEPAINIFMKFKTFTWTFLLLCWNLHQFNAKTDILHKSVK